MTFYRVLKSFRFQRYPEFSVKLQYFPDKTQNNARLFLLQFGLEELHGIGLGLLGNLDIGLHGLIVGVAGPLHHHLGRNAAGEGEADEGAASCVGANQVALGGSLLHTFTAFVVSLGNGRIEAGQFAEVLELAVHQLDCEKLQTDLVFPGKKL